MNGVADASKDEEEVNPALTASARLSAAGALLPECLRERLRQCSPVLQVRLQPTQHRL